ncbi:MAG: alkaline phosphatase family protein [Acidobacteriota bacterium]
MNRAIVLGFDGATWDLLDLLVKAGRMPNLAALLRRSVHAPLRSAHPPVTAPAWVSIATGVNPGRHGCFDFNRPDGALSRLRPLQSWDIAEKTFYEVLAERGRRVVLVNLPVTYPPLTDNITLTSLLTQGDNAVFPPSLKERHPLLQGYRVFPDTRLRARGETEAYLRDIRHVETARFDAIRSLWEEPWDLFFAVVSGTDWVSHEAFPDLSEGRFERCPQAVGMFEDADRTLGWVAERLGPGDGLLLVSDHGFTTAKGIFYLNEWLMERGFLQPDYARPAFPPSHRMEEEAQRALGGEGRAFPAAVLRAVHQTNTARFLAKVYRKLGGSWPLFFRPDPAQSAASTLTAECHGITVHEQGVFADGSVPPSRVEETLVALEEALAGLRDPEGQPVFASVQRRGQVYHGPRTDAAPHLLLEPDRWGVAAAIKALKNIPFVVHPTGIHASRGIFLAHGRGFREGRLKEGLLSVTDVAPLVFYLLGEAIPEGLDGRLVPDLFVAGLLEGTPPSFAPTGLPQRGSGDLDAEAIQERLKGLGYMG